MTGEVDPILATIAAYRSAARAIVERPGPMSGPHGKPRAIVRLVQRADTESDRVVRDWLREVIWREVRDLLGWVPPLVEEPRVNYAERVRLIVMRDYRFCPCCGQRREPGAWREGPG